MRIGRGNRSTRRKPAPVPHYPPQIPRDLNGALTRAAAVGSRRLRCSVTISMLQLDYEEAHTISVQLSVLDTYTFKLYLPRLNLSLFFLHLLALRESM
jgi:hypothetical protein